MGQNKKEGLSAPRRRSTVVLVIVGGEPLLRRGMIFFCLLYIRGAFTLLGQEAAMFGEQL